MSFEVAYAARIQVDQLNRVDKAELDRLFSSPEPRATHIAPHREGGLLISRLGADKRVLWHKLESGAPEILSVVDKSYAAA